MKIFNQDKLHSRRLREIWWRYIWLRRFVLVVTSPLFLLLCLMSGVVEFIEDFGDMWRGD